MPLFLKERTRRGLLLYLQTINVHLVITKFILEHPVYYSTVEIIKMALLFSKNSHDTLRLPYSSRK